MKTKSNMTVKEDKWKCIYCGKCGLTWGKTTKFKKLKVKNKKDETKQRPRGV